MDHRQNSHGEETVKRAIALFILTGLFPAGNPLLAAEPLGRLFFTPAQRAQLDAARAQKSRAALSSEKPEETAPVPDILTYGGAVRRSDGKSTVWINNRAVHDREAASGVTVGQVRPNGTLTLQVPQTNRSVELKVGQSVEVVSGTIEEPYSRRITAPKPASKPTVVKLPGTAAQSLRSERTRKREETSAESTDPPGIATVSTPSDTDHKSY